MLGRVHNRLSYANVMSTLAVFVALGGTTYAFTVPPDSVGTQQLKNHAVTAPKVALHSLTGAQIKSSTLGTVPNAAKLGGLPPAAYASRTEFLSRVDSVPSLTTEYGSVSGFSTAQSTPSAVLQFTPNVNLTTGRMEVSTGLSNVAVITLYVNGKATALSCKTDFDGFCSSNAHVLIAPASQVWFQVQNQGGGNLAALIGWQGTAS